MKNDAKTKTMDYVKAGICEVLQSEHGLTCNQCRDILEQCVQALARWTEA